MSLFEQEKSLFERKTEQEHKEGVQRGLAQIAGAGVGTAAGVGSLFPLAARHQSQTAAKAIQQTKDNQIAKENWKTLIQLAKGTITLDDVPQEKREFFAELLEKDADMLKEFVRDPYKAKLSLDELDRGVVKPLFEGAEKAKVKGLFPFKVFHPASPTIIGLAGMAGAVGGDVIAKQIISHNKQE